MSEPRRALVITASDGVDAGVREDTSGVGVGERLEALGFIVQRAVLPDDRATLAEVLRRSAASHDLILTTGGTGLTPRDVTPQATADAIDYEVPGLAEAMRAAGRRSTPFADLSRGIAGVVGRALVVNLPGSPRGALESLTAIEAVLDHALETLAGPFDHDARPRGPAAHDAPSAPSPGTAPGPEGTPGPAGPAGGPEGGR